MPIPRHEVTHIKSNLFPQIHFEIQINNFLESRAWKILEIFIFQGVLGQNNQAFLHKKFLYQCLVLIIFKASLATYITIYMRSKIQKFPHSVLTTTLFLRFIKKEITKPQIPYCAYCINFLISSLF